MAKKATGSGDVYGLVNELFGFVKVNFDKQGRVLKLLDRRYELLNDDVRALSQGQRDLEKDLQGVKEDIGGIAGAIAELVERDEKIEKRVRKLAKVR